MDFSKINSVRISDDAMIGIIGDFWPYEEDDFEGAEYDKISREDFNFHARALCLYTALLISGISEENPKLLNPDYEDRKNQIKDFLKGVKKYASLSDAEVDHKAEENVLNETRNCLAHGSFEISFNVHTQKILFILRSKKVERSDASPIVINAKDVLRETTNYFYDIIKKCEFAGGEEKFKLQNKIYEMAFLLYAYSKYTDNPNENKMFNNIIGGDKRLVQALSDKRMWATAQYMFYMSMLSYSQDNYYQRFKDKGEEPNDEIFDTISLIRNSFIHENTVFEKDTDKVYLRDKNNSAEEEFANIIVKIKLTRDFKNLLDNMSDKHSETAIKGLTSALKDIYTIFFNEEKREETAKKILGHQPTEE